MKFRGQWNALLVLACAAMGILFNAQAAKAATLSWTTPGDDVLDGVATIYDIRYSINLPITEENFKSCPALPDVPLPQAPGSPHTLILRGLLKKAVYYFAMKTADDQGNWSAISNIGFLVSPGTLPERTEARFAARAVIVLGFSAPVPNPAGRSMRFELSLPEAAPVQVDAFDLGGRRVRSLIQGTREAGRAEVIWNLRDDQGLPVRAGVYLMRAILPGKVVTHRAVVVR